MKTMLQTCAWIRRLAGAAGANSTLRKAVPLLTALLLAAVAFAAYMGNRRAYPSGDTVPGRLLPISMLVERDLDLDEFENEIHPGKKYCMITHDGRRLSSYPMGAAFTAFPVYAAAGLLDPHLFGDGMKPYFERRLGDEARGTVPYRLEKLAAALITALSVLFVFLACRSLTGTGQAGIITVAYAFGTSMASSASQALWSHGPSALAVAVMAWALLTPHRNGRHLALAGAAAGWAFFCRPTCAVPLVMLAPWILVSNRTRARWVWFGVGALLVVGLTSWLNVAVYGHILGGAAGRASRLTTPSFNTLMGILFSPSRGLFVFSPFLLFAFVLGGTLLLTRPSQPGGSFWLGGVAGIALYAGWVDWGAGYSFGPRLLTDVVPFLVIPLAQGINGMKPSRVLYGAFLATVALSIMIHVRGMVDGDGGWNGKIYRPPDEHALWYLKDSQYGWTLRGK